MAPAPMLVPSREGAEKAWGRTVLPPELGPVEWAGREAYFKICKKYSRTAHKGG